MNRVKALALFAYVTGTSACSSMLYHPEKQANSQRQIISPIQSGPFEALDKAGFKDHEKTDSSYSEDAFVGDLGRAYAAVQNPSFTPNQVRVFLLPGQSVSPGSLAEAVQTITALKIISKAWQLSPEATTSEEASDESDHSTAEQMKDPIPSEPVLPSLESEMNRLGLNMDLFERLEGNAFLQTEFTYLLTLKVLRQYPTPPEQWQQFQDLLRKKVERLVAIANGDPAIDIESVAPVTIEDFEDSQGLQSEKEASMVSAADIRSGDAQLTAAERFAEKDNFKQAIATARTIGENDPFYPAAQEQIKNFSNTAVQKLRQKAASAFQSAIPVSDNETKISYLKQAKAFLNEALQDYPEADQLETVKQNLAVIERDLENLTQQLDNAAPIDPNDIEP